MSRFKVSDREFNSVQIGDMVKVELNGERFWVKILRLSPSKKNKSRDRFTVAVKNDLIISKFKYNAKIRILRRNILEIMK